LTANSLQRKTGTAPKTTEQKNPQLHLVIGDCIIYVYFSRPEIGIRKGITPL
jgi:hypothetical protein